MKHRDGQSEKSKPTSTIKMKEKRLAAIDSLRDLLSLLVALQKNSVKRANLSEDPLPVQMERLSVYDRVLPLLVSCLNDIETKSSAKQPGGAPKNPHRELAFHLLTEHYCVTGKILKSKELVRLVEDQLPEEQRHSDIAGREPFSIPLAREVIKELEALLGIPKNAWN